MRLLLDITHQMRVPQERFPDIYETWVRYGIDMAKQPIPVVPAAHYQCGGIKTNMDGATSLPGSRDWRLPAPVYSMERIGWRAIPARRVGARPPGL